MNINLLTPLTNQYLSCFDTVDKQAAVETTVLAINEAVVHLNSLKETIKDRKDSISVANSLSICLALSNFTKEISEVNRCLTSQK